MLMAYVPPQVPQTEAVFYSCIRGASAYYRVPSLALVAIYRQEQGATGKASKNRDGSEDRGRFQVNSKAWDGYLAAHRITPKMIAGDNCLNAYIAAKIFQIGLKQCKDDVWCGVGVYHSVNEPYRTVYVHAVAGQYRVMEKDQDFLAWLRSLPAYHAEAGRWDSPAGAGIAKGGRNE